MRKKKNYVRLFKSKRILKWQYWVKALAIFFGFDIFCQVEEFHREGSAAKGLGSFDKNIQGPTLIFKGQLKAPFGYKVKYCVYTFVQMFP